MILALAWLALLAPASAQSVNPVPTSDAKALAKYDKNQNGKLDPAEVAAMQAEESKNASVPVESAPGSATAQPIVELSPFEVSETNTGYYARNTMSGTRLNSKLEDLGSSISVVTKQQMQDFAMLDLNDVFLYEAGTEGTGTYTAFEVDRNGMVTDQVQNNPQGSNRVRGMGAANISMDSFATSGRVPIDPSGIDAVEISRGPNSSIFGLGEGSGTVNVVPSSANFSREATSIEGRYDDRGGWRASLDVNRPLIKGKLGVRMIGVNQHTGYNLKPSGFDERRFTFMLRAQPFKSTSIRASFQSYRGSGTRANVITPRDAVSYWKATGSPAWDPIASTVTRAGAPLATYTYNAAGNIVETAPVGLAGQNFVDPVLFVDRGGIQLWEIGRMPAATATNGPNSFGGNLRLMESLVEPVRTNHPLFSTVPGLSDKSIYDWSSINLAAPNTIRDKTETSTVQLEQYLLNTERHRLAFQIAWQREDSERFNRNLIGSASGTGSSYYLYVDPNTKLLDGRANPYFGKPYLGIGEPIMRSSPYTRDAYRAQGAYVLDLTNAKNWTKWFGRQQLVGYYEERLTKTINFQYRDALVSPDSPVYAPAGVVGSSKANQATTNGFAPSGIGTRTYYHFYTGDGTGTNVDYAPFNYSTGTYGFNWFDPLANAGAGRWVQENVTLGTAGITEGSGSGVRNLIKTKGATIQSSWLQDRIVTTFGRREDENRNKRGRPPVLKSDGYSFDYAAMDGWIGDWALRSGQTQTSGAVARPLRGWAFMERARASSGAAGFVATMLGSLSFHYNKSDSFRPETPAIGIDLQELPNPRSNGKDYGFTIALGDKFYLRANRYETKQVNSRAGQSAIFAQRTGRVDFERFAGNNDAISLQRQVRVWLTAQGLSGQSLTDGIANVMKISPADISRYNNETLAETSDTISKGDEIELNYNPNSYLTVRGSVTRTRAIDANLSPHIPAWIATRLPIWESIIDPRVGTKWLDTGYNGDNPQVGSGTPRAFLQGNVITPLAIVQATEGKNRPETREWAARFSGNYRLAGMFDHQYLKRVSVSGAVRWESKGALGYYGIPVNGDIQAATALDPNRPIWDSDHLYLDAGLTYSTRVYHDKWRARFQLNVRNLQESGRLQKIGAYPDGRGHTFRIVEPRTFILTSSVDL